MKKLRFFLLWYAVFACSAYLFWTIESLASEDYQHKEIKALEERAQNIISSFQKALQSELLQAMQKGGPKAAVEICNERAPQISDKISIEEGVKISRTSLKVRNPENAANEWEKEVLESFEMRQANSESLLAMSTYKYEDKIFTYMKPIPMKGMCAMCHGTNVSKSLYSHIKEYYPDDKAVDFRNGEIRGAFVVEINN